MNTLILIPLAIAPSIALLYYIYNRDRYEKEPRRMLIKAFLLGIAIVIPAGVIELVLSMIFPSEKGIISAIIRGFIIAGLTEELLKYFVLYKGFFRSPEFNERFDGIVYAVFVSLGFATVENILFVYTGGVNVALIRAFTAVPAHALFGIAMGYYVGRARFATSEQTRKLLMKAMLIPVILHGYYNFILFSENSFLLLTFLPYMFYLWSRGLRNLNELDSVD